MKIARSATAIVLGLLGATVPSAVAQPLSTGSSAAPTTHAAAVRSLRPAATATFRTDRTDRQLQGTWMTTVTITNPPPGVDGRFFALDTFVPGGALLVSSSAAMPSQRTLAHGEWVRTGKRRFSSTFVWFRFNPAGAFAGMQRVHRTIRVAPGLDSFQATDVVELTDPAGNVVATLHADEVGKRLDA